ncbi:MAG: FAD:protein FMN transferase [Acidobacteriaceae bacterium]
MSRDGAAFAIAPEALAAAPPDAATRLYSSIHPAMGTEYTLYLYAHSCEEAEVAAKVAFDEVDRIEDLLSNYRDGSELSRINNEAGDHEVTTDPEVFRFLESAFAWSERSGGAFDMTVGTLMKTWGFFNAPGAVPSAAALREARSQVGWEKVRLDRQRRTVRFLSPGIELDSGGIGKGYAVDRAIRALRMGGVRTALLSAGSSSVYALGAPPGVQGWKIQIPDPSNEVHVISDFLLRDTSLSTANRSQKYFIEDGCLYGSIMDPRTLRPAEGVLQISSMAPSTLDSDVLSNALFVLGSEGGASLLEEFPQFSALMVSATKAALQPMAIRWPAPVAGANHATPTDREED